MVESDITAIFWRFEANLELGTTNINQLKFFATNSIAFVIVI